MDKQLSTRAGVTLTLASSCLLGSLAVAAPPRSAGAEEPVALVCDTSVLEPELGERLQRRIAEQLDPVLAAADDRIVEVRFVGYDDQLRNYEVRLELGSDGHAWSLPTIRCEACSEARLVALVVEGVFELMAISEPVDQAPPPVAPPARPAKPDVAPEPAEQRLAGMGISGAVLLGAGVGACAIGTYLLARGEVVADDIQTVRVETVDLRPAGATTLVLGTIASTVGAALLGFDLNRRNSRRRVALRVTPTYLGLSIHQRF